MSAGAWEKGFKSGCLGQAKGRIPLRRSCPWARVILWDGTPSWRGFSFNCWWCCLRSAFNNAHCLLVIEALFLKDSTLHTTSVKVSLLNHSRCRRRWAKEEGRDDTARDNQQKNILKACAKIGATEMGRSEKSLLGAHHYVPAWLILNADVNMILVLGKNELNGIFICVRLFLSVEGYSDFL